MPAHIEGCACGFDLALLAYSMVFATAHRLREAMRFLWSRSTQTNFVFTIALALAGCAQGAEASAAEAPAEPRYEWEVMSGVLWKVGGEATPLNYVVLPQIISLKIPPISERPWRGGTLVLRSRFSLLLEPIVVGPESVYLGLAAAGEIEWRHPSNRFAPANSP